MRYTILTTIVLATMLSSCAAGATFQQPTPVPARPTPMGGTPIDPPRSVGDFTLTSHTGAPISLSDLRGRPVLLFFGYTYCPDVCPTTLSEFKRVKEQLGDTGSRVAFVFISVDGARDTPERLARYVTGFDPEFIGMTGPEGQIRAIGADYGIYFEKVEIEGNSDAYLVDHSAATYLIDQEGRLCMIYPFQTAPSAISNDIRQLLEQT